MEQKHIHEYVRGTCFSMCPEKERKLRERERLLHRLEILDGTNHLDRPLADPKKTVKSFARSAAGRRSLSPSNLRPISVLEETVYFLLKKAKDWVSEYDFIFDRMRAVHQDVVIQGINSFQVIPLFESDAGFLAYSGYRLCQEPIHKYDPVINRKHLQECLKKILCLYDEHSTECIADPGNRSQLEALYLVHNLGDVRAIERGVSLEKLWRNRDVEVALTMSLAFWHGHYVQALKLLKTLPMILSCAVALHIPHIRRKALQVMSHAYSSKNLSYPIGNLQKLLLYSDDEHLIEDCKHYNIPFQNGGLKFFKGTFNVAATDFMFHQSDSSPMNLSLKNYGLEGNHLCIRHVLILLARHAAQICYQIPPRPVEWLDRVLSECTNLPIVLLKGKEKC